MCRGGDRGARALDYELGVPTAAGDAHDRFADREALDPPTDGLDRARILQSQDVLVVPGGSGIPARPLQQIGPIHA